MASLKYGSFGPSSSSLFQTLGTSSGFEIAVIEAAEQLEQENAGFPSRQKRNSQLFLSTPNCSPGAELTSDTPIRPDILQTCSKSIKSYMNLNHFFLTDYFSLISETAQIQMTILIYYQLHHWNS